jgi:hypothetical protein
MMKLLEDRAKWRGFDISTPHPRTFTPLVKGPYFLKFVFVCKNANKWDS